MNRIGEAFQKGKAFISFLTAGDPDLSKTEEYILAMEKAGADLIEIGIPFSDPIAEGEVIEAANLRALSAGTDVEGIFRMVLSVRQKTQIPLVFLTYYNPVFHYGSEAFLERCAQSGIDGLIIPDVPYEERAELKEAADRCGVAVISLIAPTSEERIAKIAGDADGFLYVVSSMGVTGVRSEIRTDLSSIIRTIRQNTGIPAAVGFGISTPEQAAQISKAADGIIVGSAIVKIIEKYGGDAAEPLAAYVKEMKKAVK